MCSIAEYLIQGKFNARTIREKITVSISDAGSSFIYCIGFKMKMQALFSSAPRRVLKDQFFRRECQKIDGLQDCLDCWKKYMQGDDRDLNASRMNLRGGSDEVEHVGYESNPYDEQWKADLRVGEATAVMIDGLKPIWRWAIHRKCSMASVWKFPNANFLDVITDAEADLEARLRKNIATGTKF